MTQTSLKGIAWNHSRALPPLVAAAQRYEELHPDVHIVWEKRTLHEFGHASLAQLANAYDLLVVDHPMMGEAADSLADFKRSLAEAESRRLSQLYVGPSFESYRFDDALYALPIDAAAPAASFRPDLLERAGLGVPATWTDLLHLARRGLARMPGFPADLFLNWMGLCVSGGGSCAAEPEHLFPRDNALASLEDLRQLASWMPPSIYRWNPVALYEEMAAHGDFAYCPFAYTYSNYARRGFAANLLKFVPPVGTALGQPMRTVLGGTGMAISKRCASFDHALRYSLFVADPGVQRDLYGPAGGQPAARAAWEDPVLDRLSGGFLSGTRSGIETAYIRPRYRGYVPLQEKAGVPIARFLQGQTGAEIAIDAIDTLYRESLRAKELPVGAEEVRTHA